MKMNFRGPWAFSILAFIVGWILATFGPIQRSTLTKPTSAGHLSGVEAASQKVSDPVSLPGERLQKPTHPVSLREALSYPSEFHRIAALARILENAAPAQFPALYLEIRTLNWEMNRELNAFFYRRWALVDPEAAVAASVVEGGRGNYCGAYSALMVWAERDPAAALEAAEKIDLPNINRTCQVLRSRSLPKPGQYPPQEAIERILQVQRGQPSDQSLNGALAIFREWAKTDPDAVWQRSLEFSDDEMGKLMRGSAQNVVYYERAKQGTAALTAWIESLPEGSMRTSMQANYAETLIYGGKTREAREFIVNMPEGSDRSGALRELFMVVSQKDVGAARAMLENMPTNDWKDPGAFSDLLMRWMRDEPERASDLLLSKISPNAIADERQQGDYNWILAGLYNKDPMAAANLVIKMPEGVRGKAFDDTLSYWTSIDAAAAGKWAVDLPAGQVRDQALKQIAAARTSQGVGEVARWLDTLPSDSGKSAAIEGFAGKLMSVSPEDALAWLRAVPVEADRIERLRRIWLTWADRDAAQRWFESSTNLTAAERAALRR